MAEADKRPVTTKELLGSNLVQTDALAKLLIEDAIRSDPTAGSGGITVKSKGLSSQTLRKNNPPNHILIVSG
jgi:hypothetical protein